jgi:hypothetical protein
MAKFYEVCKFLSEINFCYFRQNFDFFVKFSYLGKFHFIAHYYFVILTSSRRVKNVYNQRCREHTVLAVDNGHCSLDSEQWTLSSGQWTVGS